MSATHPPPLSPAEARRIDQACDRFEAAWKAGRRPAPEEYLGAAAGPERSALLRQLLLLDWDYRRRAGDEPRPWEYRARFPGDTALVEAVGRELAEPPDSTHPGPDGPHAGNTPCPGAGEPGGGGAGPGPEGGAARYELLQEVGRGGIGVVFRGRDRFLGRELAVKVLREDRRDRADARRRFLEEARVGSQLQHPAIVTVYEQGWFDERRPYFTMKLVEGHTLAALLEGRTGPGQDLPRWLGVFEQVCQAVAYAHSRGVVHRDLKPQNVMVGAFGEVQVMDWGFAKVLAGDAAPPGAEAPEGGAGGAAPAGLVRGATGLSQRGAVMGTPAYMPPEQARGEAALIDARADVFALGAILCEVLTGRPPYAGDDSEEVWRQAAAGDLADAHARLDACGADEALRELARCCLAADRLARPADAGTVAREMADYLVSAQERLRQAQLERAAAEARAQEAGAKARAERHARRLTLVLAAAAVVLLALAGSVWWWRAGVRQAENARRANVERQARDALSTARKLLAENKLAPAREQLARARAQLGDDAPALGALAAEVEAGAADLDRFQQFLDLIDRAHQAETALFVASTVAANAPHGSAAAPAPATTVGRRPAAAVPFLLDALGRYHVLNGDDWNSALEGGILGGQQVEQIRRLAYEELLWLADDVVSRQREHRSERNLAPDEAARAALVYLAQAETARPPTQALYALRARCRKALGEEAAAQADSQRADQTPATVALDHYLRGQAAFDADHLAEGAAAFEAALRLEPTHYWSLMKLGYCLCDLGQTPEDFAGAVRVFTGCILKRPDHAHAYYCRANAYSRLRRDREALADYSRAVELDPGYAEAWLSRGLAHDRLGQLEEAVADFSRVIALGPNHARAWLARGVSYHRLREWRKALADYNRAIELDPKFALAWSNRGAAYTELGETGQALRDCSRAVELAPKLALAWTSRGYLYQTLGKSDEAVADYSRAVALDPKLARAWSNRGIVYLWLGKPNQALADCSRGVALDPADAVAWNNRGTVYFRSGQWDKAVADYSQAIALDPKFAPAWDNRGNAYFQLGKLGETVTDCSRAIALDPKLARAWLNRGAAFTKLAQPLKALADFSMAIELGPNEAKGWLNRGIVHVGLEQPEQAVADLSKALELAPDHPHVLQAYLLRALAHSRLARFELARADYQEFLKRTPDHPWALDALAWLLATCPDAKLRDPGRAVELAGKAVQLNSKVGAYWKTLGVAHYRAGDGKAAVAALGKSVELGPGGGAEDRLFLAMAHRKLGHHEEADKAYEQAVQWLEKNQEALAKDKGRAEELRRCRAEAEEVLGRKTK